MRRLPVQTPSPPEPPGARWPARPADPPTAAWARRRRTRLPRLRGRGWAAGRGMDRRAERVVLQVVSAAPVQRRARQRARSALRPAAVACRVRSIADRARVLRLQLPPDALLRRLLRECLLPRSASCRSRGRLLRQAVPRAFPVQGRRALRAAQCEQRVPVIAVAAVLLRSALQARAGRQARSDDRGHRRRDCSGRNGPARRAAEADRQQRGMRFDSWGSGRPNVAQLVAQLPCGTRRKKPTARVLQTEAPASTFAGGTGAQCGEITSASHHAGRPSRHVRATR